MRFPEVLIKIQELADRLANITSDVNYVLGEVQHLREQARRAIPGWQDREVSRETKTEVRTDGDDHQTPLLGL